MGLAFGTFVGAATWRLVAHKVGVEPTISVPIAVVIVEAVVALVAANLIGAVPARAAARTPAATVLRTE